MANAFDVLIGEKTIEKCVRKVLEEIEIDSGLSIEDCVSKQIPMKPEDEILCPVCGSELKYYYTSLDDPSFKQIVFDDYCTGCGQRIDWSK